MIADDECRLHGRTGGGIDLDLCAIDLLGRGRGEFLLQVGEFAVDGALAKLRLGYGLGHLAHACADEAEHAVPVFARASPAGRHRRCRELGQIVEIGALGLGGLDRVVVERALVLEALDLVLKLLTRRKGNSGVLAGDKAALGVDRAELEFAGGLALDADRGGDRLPGQVGQQYGVFACVQFDLGNARDFRALRKHRHRLDPGGRLDLGAPGRQRDEQRQHGERAQEALVEWLLLRRQAASDRNAHG